MKLQQYLLNDYLHINYEDFSHKAVSALGILRSIEYNPLSEMSDRQKADLQKSIIRIKQIIEETHKDVQVNLFILDRNIIPQDMSKQHTDYRTNFKRKEKVKNTDNVTLSQDQIQSLLCYATMEIHELLMKEISGFSEQMFFQGEGLL